MINNYDPNAPARAWRERNGFATPEPQPRWFPPPAADDDDQPDPATRRPETRAEHADRLAKALFTPNPHPAAGETRQPRDMLMSAADRSAIFARRLGLLRDDEDPRPAEVPAATAGLHRQLDATTGEYHDRLFGRRAEAKTAPADTATIMNTPIDPRGER